MNISTITLVRSKETKKALTSLYDISSEFSIRNQKKNGVVSKVHESIDDGSKVTLRIAFKDEASQKTFLENDIVTTLSDYIT